MVVHRCNPTPPSRAFLLFVVVRSCVRATPFRKSPMLLLRKLQWTPHTHTHTHTSLKLFHLVRPAVAFNRSSALKPQVHVVMCAPTEQTRSSNKHHQEHACHSVCACSYIYIASRQDSLCAAAACPCKILVGGQQTSRMDVCRSCWGALETRTMQTHLRVRWAGTADG